MIAQLEQRSPRVRLGVINSMLGPLGMWTFSPASYSPYGSGLPCIWPCDSSLDHDHEGHSLQDIACITRGLASCRNHLILFFLKQLQRPLTTLFSMHLVFRAAGPFRAAFCRGAVAGMQENWAGLA